MIPRAEPQLLYSPSSIQSTSDDLHSKKTPKTDECTNILSPKRRSCLKGCWNGGQSSMSTLGSSCSSCSSISPSSSASSRRYVTFNEFVSGKTFVPDWADPRVDQYEEKRTLDNMKPLTPDEDELRRVDMHCIEILRKERRERIIDDDAIRSISRPSSSCWDEEQWSPRGLEVQIDEEVANDKRHLRLQSTLRILLLQARKASWEEMALAYAVVSRPSQIEAHRRGLLDELDARHEVGQTILNVLVEHRKTKWSNGQTPVAMSCWIAKRPSRQSRRFSEIVVAEFDRRKQVPKELDD